MFGFDPFSQTLQICFRKIVVALCSAMSGVVQEGPVPEVTHDGQSDVDAFCTRRQMFGAIHSLRRQTPAVVVNIKGLTPPRRRQEVVLHLFRRWPTFSRKIVEIRALPHLGLPTIQAPSRIVIVEPSGPTNVTVGLPNSNPT